MIAETAVIVVGTVLSIALPVAAWRRTRRPEKRSELWLSANAQPVLSALGNAMFVVIFVVTGVSSALLAWYRYPLMWGVVILCVGGVVSLAITAARTRQGRPRGPDLDS